VLEDIRPAQEAIPELNDRLILHAGPPIEWGEMCGPMQGAIIGVIIFEGWAEAAKTATPLAASGGGFARCSSPR
jgi:hypothetical protein